MLAPPVMPSEGPLSVARQPSPWRMAEMEEVMHTGENRRREASMRHQGTASAVDARPAELHSCAVLLDLVRHDLNTHRA